MSIRILVTIFSLCLAPMIGCKHQRSESRASEVSGPGDDDHQELDELVNVKFPALLKFRTDSGEIIAKFIEQAKHIENIDLRSKIIEISDKLKVAVDIRNKPKGYLYETFVKPILKSATKVAAETRYHDLSTG